jgi:hypothetical protein
MPSWPDVDKGFIPGDEIMAFFSADKMRRIGFADSEFINAGALDLASNRAGERQSER